MICSCPKCKSECEFNTAEMPQDGSYQSCAECGNNFVVIKESFARRALHKGDEIVCSECGSHPGPSIYCQSCHALYPDFLVIEATSAAKKRFKKLITTVNSLKSLKSGSGTQSYSDDFSTPSATAGKNKNLKLRGQPTQFLAVIMIFLLLFSGGGYYWYQEKKAQKYTKSYIRALLGIKIARDLNLKFSNRLLADLKSGKPSVLSADEQNLTTSAKNDVEILVKQIGEVPEKYAKNDSALKKLYEVYSKLHSTVKAPTGTSDTYAAAVNVVDTEFRKTASELKSGLPEKISTQLNETSKKFKALQDL